MWRTLAVIIAAFKLANPSLPADIAEGYAKTVQADAKKHHYDPYTPVAITWHESRVNSRIVKTVDGDTYVGLGQIRLQNFAACREDMESADCQAMKARLSVGAENLVMIGILIQQNRDYCRKKTGRTSFAAWLGGYQGYSGCSVTKIARMTWRVMHYRAWLERSVPRSMRGLPYRPFAG